ncbi:DUF2147 domain-containing protein [Bradyrhizobium roseum]|uniref:DUF2147 domain-containing protein n=1 Tax=Bradyrhizobium roseum TaxID=3056648 RepID=UPI0026359FC9|nr:DUF2147 domain-containing protein [Bradyrhizobium roseus]WKA29515.1 DUF2147 domain-containing protein [Bradyrhizobium roseus]
MIASTIMITWPLSANTAEPTAEGIWQIADSAGRPKGWFKIYRWEEVYEAQIVKIFSASDDDSSTLKCTACRGPEKNLPVLGLIFVIGMKKAGLAYNDGRILNLSDGDLYRVRMSLREDGAVLTVQVDLTDEQMGNPQIWSRVPDSPETHRLTALPLSK